MTRILHTAVVTFKSVKNLFDTNFSIMQVYSTKTTSLYSNRRYRSHARPYKKWCVICHAQSAYSGIEFNPTDNRGQQESMDSCRQK